ncbi:MAG: hypothetical protein RLP44_31225 [Aggregatilineales bacterium]
MDYYGWFNWKRDWAIVTGIFSFIAIGVVIALGPDITTPEYVPRYDEVVNYQSLLVEFGTGQGMPFLILIFLAGLLSVSIFQMFRSGNTNTRTAGLMVTFFTLIGAGFLCINTVTSLNFSGNSTTLEHLERVEFDGKFYALAAMDTRVTEPNFLRNSVVLFECEDATENVCRPLHTQFIGTELEADERPQVNLAEDSGVLYLSIDDDVVYQVGEVVTAPLPENLPIISPENAGNLTALRIFDGQGYALDWSSDGRMLAVGGVSGVWIYHFGDDETTSDILQTTSNGPMQAVIFSADDSALGIMTRFDDATDSGSFRVLNIADGSEQAQALFEYGNPAALGNDLNMIATGLVNDVTVRGIDRERVLATFSTSEQRRAYALAFSPDNEILAITGQSFPEDDDESDQAQVGFMALMDADRGSLVFSVDMLGTFDVQGVLAFSPDGRYVAYSRQNDVGDTNVVVWDVATQEEAQSFSILGRAGFVSSLAFSADGTLCATGSRDGTLRVWDMESGDRVFEQQISDATLNSLAFNPDGTLLTTSSEAGEITLWALGDE